MSLQEYPIKDIFLRWSHFLETEPLHKSDRPLSLASHLGQTLCINHPLWEGRSTIYASHWYQSHLYQIHSEQNDSHTPCSIWRSIKGVERVSGVRKRICGRVPPQSNSTTVHTAPHWARKKGIHHTPRLHRLDSHQKKKRAAKSQKEITLNYT